MKVEKINVTLPEETVEKLRRFVPAGQRSHVIAEATARYLEGLTQQAALHRVAGLWRNRATLRTQTHVNRMLKRVRGSTRARLRRLGGRG